MLPVSNDTLLRVVRDSHFNRPYDDQSIPPDLCGKVAISGLSAASGRPDAIAAHVSNKVPLKEIVRRTGHSRNFVRQISRGGGTDVFRTV